MQRPKPAVDLFKEKNSARCGAPIFFAGSNGLPESAEGSKVYIDADQTIQEAFRSYEESLIDDSLW